MAIPDFQTLMLPLLKVVADGREYSLRDNVGVSFAATYEFKKIDSDYFLEE